MKTITFLLGLGLSLVSEAAQRAYQYVKGKNPFAESHVAEQRDFYQETKEEWEKTYGEISNMGEES